MASPESGIGFLVVLKSSPIVGGEVRACEGGPGTLPVVDCRHDLYTSDLRVQPMPLSIDVFVCPASAMRDVPPHEIPWESSRDAAKVAV
jgi:hypothetical protein